MDDGVRSSPRCGVDRVEIARVDRLLQTAPREDLLRIFSAEELGQAATGRERVSHLAACFAAKEACLKLFPRETALGHIGFGDFAVAENGASTPHIVVAATARALLDRQRMGDISLSLTHEGDAVTAVATCEAAATVAPLLGRVLYYLLPIRRRVVLSNLQRVFGRPVSDAEIVRLAQAFYAHAARSLAEVIRFSWLPPGKRTALVRVENKEAIMRVYEAGKGVLVLTGHFGNFEVATVGGIAQFPQYRGQFHFLRRPLRPRWLDTLVSRRFRRAGLGVLPKKGALDTILKRLAATDAVIFVMDQHAGGRDGVQVDFFGQPAWTFRSLAIISLATGIPVVPAACWRAPDGSHVLRFEEPLPIVECEDHDEAIRRNTTAYNAALERLILRHPEQWFWMHRRWKDA